MNELNGFVDQIFAEVIALGSSCSRIDSMVVVDQIGSELIGLSVEESIEAIETTLQWPRVIRACSRRLVHRTQMPFPKCERRVADVAKHLGHRRHVLGNPPGHMRIARVEVRDAAHAHGVMVPTS